MPSPDTFAILRSRKGDTNHKDYSYRPYVVKQALLWLKKNNHLYKDIALNFDDHDNINWDNQIQSPIEAPIVPLSDEDMQCINEDIFGDLPADSSTGNFYIFLI
jgi:hypothetical protein